MVQRPAPPVLAGGGATAPAAGSSLKPPGMAARGGPDQGPQAEAGCEDALRTATEWVRQAHLLVIGLGSAEPDCSGPPGEQRCSPLLFTDDPHAAWELWRQRHQEPAPSPPPGQAPESHRILGAWMQHCPLGPMICTTDVEGHFLRSGLPPERVLELDGSARKLQCAGPCCDDVWDAGKDLWSNIAEGALPTCRRCSRAARPCVRLSSTDTAFVLAKSMHEGPEVLARAVNASKGLFEPNVLCLELDCGDAAPMVREHLVRIAGAIKRAKCRHIRIGVKCLEDVARLSSHVVNIPLDVPRALSRISASRGAVEMAVFIVRDVNGMGIEIVQPINQTVEGLLLGALNETNYVWERIEYEPFQVWADHLYSGADDKEPLTLHQRVPSSIFAQMCEGEIGTMITVMGVRFPMHNPRLQGRILAVRSLLSELVSSFTTSEYQERLAAARDQMEVKAMIKEVHANVIPKYGFPLSLDTPTGATIKTQIRMQTFIDSCSAFDEVLSGYGIETLRLSGVRYMSKLPVRSTGAGPSLRKQPFEKYAKFRHQDPLHPVLYGAWAGERRAPAAFLEAPSFGLMAYLRDDPEGPFLGGVDDWPDDSDQAASRWRQWGFQEDAKEAILKADWHTLPQLGQIAELFVPRLAKLGMIRRAPTRYMALMQAFRAVNQGCFETLAASLRELSVVWFQKEGADISNLVQHVVACLKGQRHFGMMEVQVWWGEGSLTLPSHKDGATSLLHLGLTLGGSRTLRIGTFASADETSSTRAEEKDKDVWDTFQWSHNRQLAAGLKDAKMMRGSAYISSPYVFEHGVRFERGSRNDPIISLQCRFAFEPDVGKQLNAKRNDLMHDISSAIAGQLQRSCERGELRMPSILEVRQEEQKLVARLAAGGNGPFAGDCH
mmetsp:Transcript_16291/g.46497  ORF Transcript_16291/g.46497 Transcript_16291/m.46497 type:complete len:892 (-) Transcript_16291:76-2751(-)